MKFEIVGEITQIETIAVNRSIRVLPLLIKRYGRGRWRKKKGFATVKLKTEAFTWLKFIGMKRTESGGKSLKSSFRFWIEL